MQEDSVAILNTSITRLITERFLQNFNFMLEFVLEV